MSSRLVSDELWRAIAPLFPQQTRSPQGGRPPVENRTVFTCVAFLLKTGIGWRDLPMELGASSRTVRRRLKEWTDQGVWSAIAHQLLTRLRSLGRLDLAEVLIDGGLVKAPHGGEKRARTPQIEAAVAAS